MPAPTASRKVPQQAVRAKLLPRPSRYEPAEDNALALLTDDGTAVTQQLARALGQRGFRVVLLRWPDASPNEAPTDATVLTLDGLDEEAVQRAVQPLRQQGSVRAFVHLHPVGTDTDLTPALFWLAKHLQPLFPAQDYATFTVAVRLNGTFGYGATTSFDWRAGGLSGLVKSLNREWPSVLCRTVDLHPALTPEQVAGHLLAELYDTDLALAEVGYRADQSRVTLVTEERAAASTASTTIQPSDVIVVTGGARGITAQCVVALAKSNPCTFVLLGRTRCQDEPDWARGITDEKNLKQRIFRALQQADETPRPVAVQQQYQRIVSSRSIRQTLEAIRRAGGQARYVEVDITDATALRAALPTEVGPVTGIIHGAGALADKRIAKKTEADFTKVYHTKVQGLFNLLEAVDTDHLRHLLMFSSIVGFYGNEGQTDYALANDTLNKWALSYQTQHPDTKVTAVNWGPWKTGMVTEYIQQEFARRGVTLIPVDEGVAHFQQLMTEAPGGVVIVNKCFPAPHKKFPLSDRPLSLPKRVTAEENPFLAHHVIGGHPVMPFVTGIAWITNAAEQLYPAYHLVRSQDSKLFNGIIFNGTQADTYTLDIQVTEQDDQHVRLRGKVWSQDERGRRRYHYGSDVLLLATVPEAPTYELPHFSGEPLSIRDTLYKEGSLFHGPAYQGIEALWHRDDQELWYTCRLPEPDERTQGQFPLRTSKTFATDAMCQGFLVWAYHHLGTSCLPAGMRQMTIYEPLPFDETFWVHLRITEHRGPKIVGDVTALTAAGRVLVAAEGVALTASQELLSLYRPSQSTDPLAVVDLDIRLPGFPNLETFYRAVYDGTLSSSFVTSEPTRTVPNPDRRKGESTEADPSQTVIRLEEASATSESPDSTPTAATLAEAYRMTQHWLSDHPTGSVVVRAQHGSGEASVRLMRASHARAVQQPGYAVIESPSASVEGLLPTLEYLEVDAGLGSEQWPSVPAETADSRCALSTLPSAVADLATDSPLGDVVRLVKAALCLHYRFLPALPEAQRANLFAHGNPPFFYASEYSFPWIPENKAEQRVAALGLDHGASWFPLREAEPPARKSAVYLRQQDRKLLLVSGNDPTEVQAGLAELAEAAGSFSPAWAEERYRQQQDIPKQYTVSLVAGSAEQLTREVSSAQRGVEAAFGGRPPWQTPTGSYFTAEPLGAAARVGFVYPGLASSYGGMMKDYLQLFPHHLDYYHAQIDQVHELVHHPLVHPRYRQAPDPAERREREAHFLNNTVAAAESSISLSVLATRVLRQDFGLQPEAALGYSMGGITMLFATEVWGFRHLHSRVQQSPVFRPDPAYRHWTHWVLNVPAEQVRQQLSGTSDLYLTFINSPENVIISGDRTQGEAWLQRHRYEGMVVDLHNVAHCPPVRTMYHDLRQMHVLEVEQTPATRFYSGATQEVLSLDQAALAQNAADTYCQPVDFVSLVQRAYQDGINVFVEVGPKAWCARLVGDILRGQPHVALSVDQKGVSDYRSLLKLSSVLSSHSVPIRLPFYDSASSSSTASSPAVKSGPEAATPVASGSAHSPEPPPAEKASALRDLDRTCYVYRDEDGGYRTSSTQRTSDRHALVGVLPPLPPEQLGSADFRQAHGLRYAYMAGAMANGIASEELVIALGQQGMLGSFGAAGLRPERVEEAIHRIQAALPQGPYAINLIHSPSDAALEMRLVDMYLHHRVPTLEASAFMELTPALVYYRAAGLSADAEGRVQAHNKIIAKVSRPEVARQFMQPAPAALLEPLVQQGKITAAQRDWAQQVPMADDITVEADSGGHTDRQPLVCALPEIIRLKERLRRQHDYPTPLRVGAAGGISTPASVVAAFALGADYVVTGSINQACQEAGTSPKVKSLLAQASAVDVGMAPSSDMFEMGVSVQVLKRGTLYANRAQKLYRLYQQYDSLDAIPAQEREKLEKQLFQKPVAAVWSDVEDFFQQYEPHQLAAARQHPKKKMALVFRWYLGLSSKWAVSGAKERAMDYQVWCGPSMGAFNDWVKGSPLEAVEHRHVAEVARRLLSEAAGQHRQQLLALYQVPPPGVGPTVAETAPTASPVELVHA